MRLRFAALRLDRVAQRFLHEARGIDECAIDRVVALIRHASEHEGVRCATADSLPMHDHHVHGRRHRIAMAVRDHRQAVPEHRHVDAGHLCPLCGGIVRHRHVDHFFAGALRLADFRNRALLALALGVSGLRPGPGRFGRRLRCRHCAPPGHSPRPLREPLIYVSYVTDDCFRRSRETKSRGRQNEAKRVRMLPGETLIPLTLFTALLLVLSLHILAASGQFPREHRAPALASGVGGIVLYGTIAVTITSLVVALLAAWRLIPWYAAVIGGGLAILVAPLALQQFPDRFVDGRASLLSFAAAGALL